MRFRKLEIRHHIKERARAILIRNLMPALKLCMILIAIYGVVEVIKLYAGPIPETNGESVSAFLNAYLNMGWQKILTILMINVLSVIVIGPLLCTFCGFFMKITGEKSSTGNADLTQIIQDDHRISHYMTWFFDSRSRTKAIKLRFVTSLLSVFWHALFVGPPLALLYFLRGNPSSIHYQNSMFIYLTWMVCGYVLAYIKVGTYYPAYFLISQDPQMSIPAALLDSVRMMKGHALEFVGYKLSFVPWYLIAAITFGFGLLYVVPLRGVGDALFMRYIDRVSSGGDPF